MSDNIGFTTFPPEVSMINSIQTGWFAATGQTTGAAGEDAGYRDITLSPAVVVAKCVCFVQPVIDGQNLQIRVYAPNTVRISTPNTSVFGARWYVVEFK